VTLTYAIADLHGRFDLLCRASDRIYDDAAGQPHKLVVLGDFIDRGPNSREIIEILSNPPLAKGREWIVLQGNHEDIMLQAFADPARCLRWWIGNGGGQTLQSYGYQHGEFLQPSKVPQANLDWLASLPFFHEDAHRIFVHAGVPPHLPLTETAPSTLQWMLYPSEESYPDAEVHSDEAHCSGKHIVHGHHQSATHPLLKPHRTNLDSFAWNTGRLAIGVFDDSQAAPVRILWAEGAPA
jgi:serine/threonine protein phosphatase 1